MAGALGGWLEFRDVGVSVAPALSCQGVSGVDWRCLALAQGSVGGVEGWRAAHCPGGATPLPSPSCGVTGSFEVPPAQPSCQSWPLQASSLQKGVSEAGGLGGPGPPFPQPSGCYPWGLCMHRGAPTRVGGGHVGFAGLRCRLVSWAQITACVTAGQLLTLSVPRFAHVYNAIVAQHLLHRVL